jgi:hypothetical protein
MVVVWKQRLFFTLQIKASGSSLSHGFSEVMRMGYRMLAAMNVLAVLPIKQAKQAWYYQYD